MRRQVPQGAISSAVMIEEVKILTQEEYGTMLEDSWNFQQDSSKTRYSELEGKEGVFPAGRMPKKLEPLPVRDA